MADQIISRLLLGLDTREFRNGIRNADRELKSWSKGIDKIGEMLGAAFAVGVIADFTMEAVKLGDELNAAAAGFERFGNAADMQALRDATGGMVSDVKLMQQAIQAGNFGIPIEELGNLFAFAQQRAKETGQEVDYLTQSIVTGIGRKSPLILDNLGISAVQLREKLGGVSAEAANIADVTRAVGQIATEELSKMAPPIEDATTKTKQLATNWENFKANLGRSLSPLANGFLTLANAIMKGGEAMDYTAKYRNTSNTYGMFGQVLSTNAALVQNMNQAIQDNNWFINENKRYYELFNPAVQKTVTTLGGLKEKLAELQKEFEETDVSTARFRELNKEIAKLQERINKLTGSKMAPALSFVDPVAGTDWLEELRTQLFQGSMSWLEYEQAQRDALDTAPLEEYMVYHQDMTDEIIPGIQNIVGQYAKLNQTINATASILGNVLQESFEAALVNGEDFFKVLLDGLKKMAMRLAATAAAAFALSIALKSMGIGSGVSIGNMFKVVGGQMGIPGLGGSSFNPTTGAVENGLFGGRTTLRGNDIYLANSRSGYDLGRIG
jgi:hypothetical protein